MSAGHARWLLELGAALGDRTLLIPDVSGHFCQRLTPIITAGKFKVTKRALGSNCTVHRAQLNKHNRVRGHNHAAVSALPWEVESNVGNHVGLTAIRNYILH